MRVGVEGSTVSIMDLFAACVPEGSRSATWQVKREAVWQVMVEGQSLRSVARASGVHFRSVVRWVRQTKARMTRAGVTFR